MDRNGSGKLEAGHKGRKQSKARPQTKGLRVVERDGYWHIQGTLRVKGRSIRVRKSTGYEARPETKPFAEEDLDAIRDQIRGQELYGQKPSRAVSLAATDFINKPRARPYGATSVAIVLEINERFGTRLLNDIPEQEWTAWVDQRCQVRAAAGRERFISTVLAFLNWCHARPREWLTIVPLFDRDQTARNPNRRARRRVAEITPQMVALMVEMAAPHLKPQIAVYWSTGARSASLFHGCRVCDLSLAEGRESLTFDKTKNGTAVTAVLHPWAADILRDYMKWRGNWHKREEPLFLTATRKPYRENNQSYGGQNKRAWNTMKRRCVKHLRRAAAKARIANDSESAQERWEEAKVMKSITPHWFRHKLATDMLGATEGSDIRSVMEQGGWLDPRTVIGYTHDVPKRRRNIIAGLDAPTTIERKEG